MTIFHLKKFSKSLLIEYLHKLINLFHPSAINKKKMTGISNSHGTFTQKSIYDIHGKLLINYNKLDTRSVTNNIYSILTQGNTESNQNININMSQLSAGMYLIRLEIDGKTVIKKITRN
jgi:hypothetical protein